MPTVSGDLSGLSQFYKVIGTQRFGDQVHTLIRFKIPQMGREKRRRILEAVMDESGADAMIECFWTKGSIVYKEKWSFDAILIKKRDKMSRRLTPTASSSSHQVTRADYEKK